MAPITWTKDGAVGDETVEFSKNGIRIALVRDDGTLEDFDHWELDMFGGVLPNVGDHLATLWNRGDPENEEHLRVLGRYYVGEFAGDNCWWLIVANEPLTERDKLLFKLARSASAETRRVSALRPDYAALARMRLEGKKAGTTSRKPGRKGKRT